MLDAAFLNFDADELPLHNLKPGPQLVGALDGQRCGLVHISM